MRRAPKVGDVVLWYPGSDRLQQPSAAVVTRDGNGGSTICLNVMDPSTTAMLIRDGVRHLDDNRSRTEFGREVGAWDYTARDKQLDELLASLLEASARE